MASRVLFAPSHGVEVDGVAKPPQGQGHRAHRGLGFRGQGLGIGVQGLGFGVQGLGFRV